MQKASSKGVRRVTKTKLKVANPEEEVLPEDPSEVVNSYNVSDYKHTKGVKGKGKNNKVNK